MLPLSFQLMQFFCRNQAEMAHTCRGTISLHGAVIHTEHSTDFVISNSGTQTFHLKASSEVERQRWVTALELAKAKAIRAMESGNESYHYRCKNLKWKNDTKQLSIILFLFANEIQ